MTKPRPKRLTGFLLSLAAVATVTGVRFAVEPLQESGQQTPFLLFGLAVLASAWWGGPFAAVFATIVSSFFAWHFLFHGNPDARLVGFLPSLAMFLFQAVIIAVAAEVVRTANRRLAAEKERLSVTLRSVGDGVIATDANGAVVLMNRVAETLTGWKQEEAVGRPLAEVFRIISEETREPCEDPVGKVLASGRVVGLANHTLLVSRDGTERCVADSGAPIRGDKGEVTGVVLVFRDQTEERQAQRLHRELFDDVAVGLLRSTAGPEGTFVDVNPALVEMMEADNREQLMALHPSDMYVDPDERRIVSEVLMSTGFIKGKEVRFKTLKGKPIWCRISCTRRVATNGQTYFDNTIENITERKLAEEALRRKNLVFDGSIAANSIADASGVLTDANAAFVRAWGYSSQNEVLGRQIPDFLQSQDEAVAIITALDSTGEWAGDYTAKRQDGTTFTAHGLATVLRNEAGAVVGYQSSVMDITKRKLAEEALAVEKERLAVTLRSIGDGVITTDVHGAVVLMNRVAEELTGWTQDEAAGRPLRDVFRIIHQATREPCEDPVAKVLASGRVVGLENHTVLIAKDGTEKILGDSGAPIRDRSSRIMGVVLVFRDMTDDYRREAESQRAQKLESVGLLAGGIAHDFNNLLTAVLGYVSLARSDVAPETPQAGWLSKAENAVNRARDLAQQLLTFSKGGAPILRAARIGETIIDSTGFSLRGSSVRAAFSLPDDLWPVEADLGQLSQVISNLVINAAEAMPGGGTIRVGAQNLLPCVTRPSTLPEGRFVEISVEDQGIGISEEHLQQVFDPYFTTKKKGSGLGLTTCYSIIRNHAGLITLDSRRGHGSTFRVFLPVSMTEPVPRAPDEAAHAGRGRILVMDDEETVLGVCSEMLAYLGYEVETATDGAEAIEKFTAAKASPRPFDAVILDITVPGGMGGQQAIGRLLEIDPEVLAIVSSGYSTDPIMADFRTHGFRAIAVKPYNLRSLSMALRDVLSRLPERDGDAAGIRPVSQ